MSSYLRLVILVIFPLFLPCCGGGGQAPQAPVVEIQTGFVEKKDIPLSREFVGRTVGSVDADVRARVQGVLLEQHFKEGGEVTEGQLLYTIDSAPFLAKVAEAKARLVEAKTRLVKAQSDHARMVPLAKISAVSQRDLDQAVAAKGVAEGGVDAAAAGVEAAEIELGYTKVVAPTTGTIGISKYKVGEVVGSSPITAVLNTVSKLDPIHVQFSVNEGDYLYFARKNQGTENAPKRSLELILADNSVLPAHGEVVKIDRSVDPNSGAIMLEASFPNADKLLRPGLFAKLRTVAEMRHGAVIVPKKAVKEVQGKQYVFVIDSNNRAEQRAVNVGQQVAEMQIIESGVTAGETIALDGIQRLRSGSVVSARKVS